MSDMITTRPVLVPRARGRGGWGQFTAAVVLAWRTHATRRALAVLSDHELADIGLSRGAAMAEAARLPWDTRPVRHWRRARGAWAALQAMFEGMRARRIAQHRGPSSVFWGG